MTKPKNPLVALNGEQIARILWRSVSDWLAPLFVDVRSDQLDGAKSRRCSFPNRAMLCRLVSAAHHPFGDKD